MSVRFCSKALLLAGLLLPLAGIAVSLTGCSSASSGLDSITVSPNTALQLVVGNPATIQLTVTGTFGNAAHATTGPVANVTWTSAIPLVAKVDQTGVVSAVSAGTTTITATAQGFRGPVSSSVQVTVLGGTTGGGGGDIVSISVIPDAQSVAAPPQTTQFVALGTDASGSMKTLSSQVTWISSSAQIATICNAGDPSPCTALTIGLATATGKGVATITALYKNTDQSTAEGTATFTVTGASVQQITSLTIIPGSQTVTLPLGAPVVPTANFVVIGTNGSGLQLNETDAVSWTSSDTAVATINTTGGVTLVGQGNTTITAQYTNLASGSTPLNVVTATATLTVNGIAAEPLLSIAVLPGAQSVGYAGQTSQLIAIGTFSAAPITQDLTTSTTYPITWSSSNNAVATVSQTGLVTAQGQGTAAITAIAKNPDHSVVTGTATFTVQNGTAEQITALTIIPGSLSLSATGQPGQFTALGTSGTTGLQIDVTHSSQLVWSSSIPTYATIATSPAANAGQAKGVSAGSTNITAQWTNTDNSVVAATATVSVTTTPAAEPLLSIAVLPASITDLNLLGTGQFLAYGTFSTAPTQLEITNGFSHVGFPPSCTSLPCPLVQVNWVSTAPFDFPVNSAGASGANGGLSTADASGNTDIYAVAANPDGTLVYSSMSTFNCPYAAPTFGTTIEIIQGVTVVVTDYQEILNPGTCNSLTIADSLLSTLTVFNANPTSTGLNQADWLITAPSATGTADVIHCGGTTEQNSAGGSVCEATYPNNTKVLLTAPKVTGVNFGGWSSSCTPSDALGNPITAPPFWTAAGPNYCTVVVGGGDCTANGNTGTFSCSGSNVSVGAIFN